VKVGFCGNSGTRCLNGRVCVCRPAHVC